MDSRIQQDPSRHYALSDGDDRLLLLRRAYAEAFREGVTRSRFVLFHPTDRGGWGNRLRGLTLCFAFALCTRRVLVVDDFLVYEHFIAPEGTDWSIRTWRSAMDEIFNHRRMNLKLRPEDFDPAAWKTYETQSMEDLFPEKVIVLNQSIGFIDALFRNPHYIPLLVDFGLDTDSKLSWLGSVCKFLLSRPTRKLLASVRAVSRQLGFTAGTDIGVQFRSFFDIGSPNQRYLATFVDKVEEDIKRRRDEQDSTIYVLTDDPIVTRSLSHRSAALGRVVSWPHRTLHTGGPNAGMGLLVERGLRKAFGARAGEIDLLGWLPEAMRLRPHSSVLAEWFLLGECKRIYSTFSSFAVFAAARTGNSAELIKYNTETDSLAPLRNEQYFY